MAKKKISPINEEFDFKLLITIARKSTMWFALFVLTAILTALLILRYTAPVYEASSIIQLSEQDNARSVLNETTVKRFGEQNNKLASSIELIRSKVILERVLKRLPFEVSYYSKGEILTNELYKISPFSVEIRVKDSSILEEPILIEFKSENSFSVVYPFSSSKITATQEFKENQWVSTDELDFKIDILDYTTIQTLQKDLTSDAIFFKINSLTAVADQIIKELVVTPLNSEAKTIQIKLKDKNQQKATDIVNGIAAEFNKYDLEKNSEVADKILDFIDNTIA